MKDLEGRHDIKNMANMWRLVPEADRNYSHADHSLTNIFNSTKRFPVLERGTSIFIYTQALVKKVQEQYPTCGDIRQALINGDIVVPVQGNEDAESDQKIMRKLFGFKN